jgi:hypothetical protein
VYIVQHTCLILMMINVNAIHYKVLSFLVRLILSPYQNINKSESKKLDVFDSIFGPNTFTFIYQLLLIFWDGGVFIKSKWSNQVKLVTSMPLKKVNISYTH